MSSQDIHARSATTTPMPSVRNQEEVAKLIDVSKCIGCKACQVACSEWNELRDEVGHNHGTYDNPMDLTADSWTVMRFTEHENEAGNLEWLIRKDGCMHCAEPGCLRPARAGGDREVRQRHRRLQPGQVHRLRLLHHRLPVRHPTDLAEGPQGLQVQPVFRPRLGGHGAGLREDLPDRRHRLRQQEDMKEHAAERIVDLKSRGYENAGLYDPEGVGGTHVMYVLHHADKPSLYAGLADQPSVSPLVSLWKGVTAPLALLAMGATVLAGFFHYVRVGPNRADDEEDHGQAEAPVHQVDPSVHTFDPHERR